MTRKSIFLLQLSSKLGGLSRAAEQERKKKVHYLQRLKRKPKVEGPTSNPRIREAGKERSRVKPGLQSQALSQENKDRQARETAQYKPCRVKRPEFKFPGPCVKEARCRAPVRGGGENRSMGQAVWHSQQTNESSQAGAMSSDLLTSTSMLWHSCPCIHAHPKACAHADKHMYIHINKIFKNLKQEKGRSKAKNSTNF